MQPVCVYVCARHVRVTSRSVYLAVCGCMSAGENVCLVNNICAFSSLCYSPDLFGSAVCATAEAEGGRQWGAVRSNIKYKDWCNTGYLNCSLHICPSICIHSCSPIYTISVCLLSPSISVSEDEISRELRVTVVNNVELLAYYWASASICIKPPLEAKANIDVLMLWGKYHKESDFLHTAYLITLMHG